MNLKPVGFYLTLCFSNKYPCVFSISKLQYFNKPELYIIEPPPFKIQTLSAFIITQAWQYWIVSMC